MTKKYGKTTSKVYVIHTTSPTRIRKRMKLERCIFGNKETNIKCVLK